MRLPNTVSDRLTRIETLLEGIADRLDRMERHINTVETAQRATNEDYQKMKNRGAGILIGVALFAGSLGAGATKLIERLTSSLAG